MKKAKRSKMNGRRQVKVHFDDFLQERLPGDPPTKDPPSRDCVSRDCVSSAPAEYVVGLVPQLYNYDLQAIFRDAVLRVQQIFTGRLLGILGTEESREADRRLLSGTLEMVVLPGAQATMIAQPQVPFRPTRVVIDDEASDFYDVVDVKVGKNSQLVSSHPIPGSSFRAGTAKDLKMDAATIAMFLTVELVNVSGKPRRFPRVMMFGQPLKENHR